MGILATPQSPAFKRSEGRKKRVAILGSTGSIGVSTLEVLSAHADRFQVSLLTAGSNAQALDAQIRQHSPQYAFLASESARGGLSASKTKVLHNEDELYSVLSSGEFDLVVAAVVGFDGLPSVIAAIEGGSIIALANKEALVSAGTLISEKVSKHQTAVIPVDSEHSAIFQALQGEFVRDVDEIVLTASGGPFFGYSAEKLAHVTPEQALRHPTWEMGAKLTVDSASMVNKTLELAEAFWLFGITAEKIKIVVHPQSIIHSMVNFQDGSSIAQMGVPDMKVPIAYALNYPQGRLPDVARALDLTAIQDLNFYPLDDVVFRAPRLMRAALDNGGVAAAVFTIANDIAVERFLKGALRFDRIVDSIEVALERFGSQRYQTLSDLLSLRNTMYDNAESFIVG